MRFQTLQEDQFPEMLCRQRIYKLGEDFLAVLGAIQFNLEDKCTPHLRYMLVYISIELYRI